MAKLVLSASGGASTFTIDQPRSTVFIGELASWSMEGDGGWVAPDPIEDVWKQSDVGEPGAVFASMPAPLAVPFDATICPGPDGCHAWPTDGVKTITHHSWMFGTPTKSQTSTVTVLNPNTYAWNYQVFYDPTGDTTGFPAEVPGQIVWATSEAEFRALRNSASATDHVQLRVRENIPIPITVAEDWSQNFAILYIAGVTLNAPVLFSDATPLSGADSSTPANFTMFYPRSGSPIGARLILNNIRLAGAYNATTGRFERSKITLAGTGGIQQCVLSTWRCHGTGLEQLAVGTGVNTQQKEYEYYAQDNTVRGNQNFELGFASYVDVGIVRGCLGFATNLTNTGDLKPGTVHDYQDHGFCRFGSGRRMALVQCMVVERGSWTGGGYDIDQPAQPIWRAYSDQSPVGHRISYLGNRTCGRSGVEIGRASDTESIVNPPDALIACNNHDCHHQGAFLVKAHCGGARQHSNVIYRPKLESDTPEERVAIYLQLDVTNVTNAAWQYPVTNWFNTFVYEGDATYDHIAPSVPENELQTHGGLSPVVTTGQNIIVGIGVAGGGPYTAITALARGDDFRPITGGDAVITSATGPPVDINGVKRSNPTNIGAHHAPGPDVAVAAPTKPSGALPEIAVNASEPADVIATSEGDGWVVPDDPFEGAMFDITWYDQGVEVANNPHAPMYRGAYTSLTQRHRKTNRGGQLVSATSAPLTP